MKRLRCECGLIFLGLTVMTAGAQAQGTTVYRHVDENGVVSFSDSPPGGEQESETLQINTPTLQDPDVYLENLNAMRETTDRMAQDRRERERHRAEIRELNTSQRDSTDTQVVEHREYEDYWPVYRSPVYGRPGRPPWRPGYRPKPEHPVARPPYRPSHPGIIQGPNSQLMRPILSQGR